MIGESTREDNIWAIVGKLFTVLMVIQRRWELTGMLMQAGVDRWRVNSFMVVSPALIDRGVDDSTRWDWMRILMQRGVDCVDRGKNHSV